MSQKFIKTKPSFLEAGLPCSSLSAECQRDNNARQRPPQNRLHIWWARRPPTISRAAILSALIPHDISVPETVLPVPTREPAEEDLDTLTGRQERLQEFFSSLITDIPPTELTAAHRKFLRMLGITGDSDRAYRRLSVAEGADNGKTVTLGSTWGYRHERAFFVSPGTEMLHALNQAVRQNLGLEPDEPVTLLDCCAGGGVIPLEGVRYGMKVYANDVNPVATIVLRATMEFPAKYSRTLSPMFWKYAKDIHARVRQRLMRFFPFQPAAEWWPEEAENARRKFRAKDIIRREPATGVDAVKNTYLWCRTIPCPSCQLNIPLSTNFHVHKKKGQAAKDLAAFPEVPPLGQGNVCEFRIVGRAEWGECRWPRRGFTHWHPTDTPTYTDGTAICPRCGHQILGDEVKAYARSREGGLPVQMYAVTSQVPVKLTYRARRGQDPEVKIRYLWRFRPPTSADLAAVRAAEQELARLRPRWEQEGLVPTETILPGDKTREPRNMGMKRWCDLFTTRQLLVNMTVVEEIRAAIARVRQELPEDQAEAVSVYLSFILAKIVNYNSVNTYWHYGRLTVAQTFSRHDFAFRPAFCEFEGARETILWGASQVMRSYEDLARLIHGESIDPNGAGDDEDEEAETEVAEDDLFANDDSSSGDEEAEGADLGNGGEDTVSLEAVHLRPEVIVPTVTNDDAAALSHPAPGSVHLICMDPPYYNNVQYSELSDFFYVWHKRTLRDLPGLASLFHADYADNMREAVANAARWDAESQRDREDWAARLERRIEELRTGGMKKTEATRQAKAELPEPLNARERADRFYENKMMQIFRRCRALLHPAGRMVVMFNHRMTSAWRALGVSLIEAGFEIRSSVPIHTEAETSLNIRGLDAARSTILLLCVPREEREQPPGNMGMVKTKVRQVARQAAAHFSKQGLGGTDLFLSSLGPALRVVGENWPVTDLAGRPVNLEEVLEEAYGAVGLWRLEEILAELTQKGQAFGAASEFNAEEVDASTQTLWLWLDVFQGDQAASDDVRRMAKSLGVDPGAFERLGILRKEQDIFTLLPPQQTDLRALSLRQRGLRTQTRREEHARDDWEQRTFPNFLGAAVWNAIGLKIGAPGEGAQGIKIVERWMRESGYASQQEFIGAFAVTLHLLEKTFGKRVKEDDPWRLAAVEARNTWNLLIKDLMD